MSYVLDALKNAAAERERARGAVPGLHAHPAAQQVLEVAVAGVLHHRVVRGAG